MRPRIRSFHFLLCAAALAVLLSACSTNIVPKPMEADDSIVLGYIDMADAPTYLHWVEVRQYAPPTKEPKTYTYTADGAFFEWYFKPGTYAVSSFGGQGFGARYIFSIPRQMDSMRFKIKKPGIYFLGSYKYASNKSGEFELDKLKNPTEAEVIKKIMVYVKGTSVEPKLQARLKELQ